MSKEKVDSTVVDDTASGLDAKPRRKTSGVPKVSEQVLTKESSEGDLKKHVKPGVPPIDSTSAILRDIMSGSPKASPRLRDTTDAGKVMAAECVSPRLLARTSIDNMLSKSGLSNSGKRLKDIVPVEINKDSDSEEDSSEASPKI